MTEPTMRFFLCFRNGGSEGIDEYHIDSEKLKKLFLEDNVDDEDAFNEWIYNEYLPESNFETWTEIKPSPANLKTLKILCDAMEGEVE